MNRIVRVAVVVVAVFVLGTSLLGVNADAATTHVRTISTASAGPAQPFQAFDTTPKAFDIDGDGKKEIIAHNDNRHIYIIDSSTGAILADLRTTYPSGWGARPLNSPEVATFTSGGAPHVVVANSAAYISMFRYDGKEGGSLKFTKLWETRLDDCFSNPGMDAKPVLADLNRDGKLEILAQTEENGVYALRFDGSIYWKACIGGGNGEPAVADLDHDGQLDVVWASDGGTVTAMDGRGWTKWTFSARNHGNFGTPSMPVGPTIAQVDGVGPLDVVVGARDSHDANNFDNNHAVLFVIKGDGKLLWFRQHPEGNPLTYTHPIVYDVDNDGQADILWADWNTMGHKPGNWELTGPANFYRYDAAGNLRWRLELPTYWNNKDMALADVDGDGVMELVINGPGCGGDGIWFINSRTGAKETCVGTHPWKVTRGPVIYDLWSTGTMQIVVPVEAASNSVSGGAIMIFNTNQPYKAPWPHPPGPASSGGSTPPPPSGSFSASFEPRSQDNNWWVEVKVSSDRPISSVVATANGATSHQLDKTSWGTWARSFHAPDGTEIKFTARDGSGNEATSAAYTWGDASAPPPPPPPPPPSSDYDADFKLGNVNNWWVEVYVDANHGVTGVTATVNGGSPVALQKQSWGPWAKSFHVPTGANVVFTARDSHGHTDQSQTFTWLQSGGGGGGGGGGDTGAFTATFSPRAQGNDWWVEVAVTSNEPIAKVEAQRDGGSWTTLPKTDWGTYAKSIHAPDGTQVRFRATSTGGEQATSSTYTW